MGKLLCGRTSWATPIHLFADPAIVCIWKLIQVASPGASQHIGARRQKGESKAAWSRRAPSSGSETPAQPGCQQDGIFCHISSLVSSHHGGLFIAKDDLLDLFLAFWPMAAGPARQCQFLPMGLLKSALHQPLARGSMGTREHIPHKSQAWVCQG